MRPRRSSIMGSFGPAVYDSPSSYRPQYQNPFRASSENVSRRPRTAKKDSDDEDVADERAPLIPPSSRSKSSGAVLAFGYNGETAKTSRQNSNRRDSSKSSSKRKKKTIFDKQNTFPPQNEEYNVNYPPSVPGSPE